MKISIVTINYNCSEKTIKLLDSLKPQIKNTEIIVIDNGSEDTDRGKLEQYKKNFFWEVILIKNKNTGFSGGSNAGIKEALKNQSDWIILLNNDTWVENGFIESVNAILSSSEGIIGLPIDEGDEKISYGGIIKWLRPTLSHGHGELNSTNQIGQNHYPDKKRYAIGSAMCVYKGVFNKIGFFNENYFLYFEDVDFSFRARKEKISIKFINRPIVHHSVSSSSRQLGSPRLLRYHYRNALYFNYKNGPWYIKILVWPWSIFIFKKQVFKIMIGRDKEKSKEILRGVRDWWFNRMGKINT